MFSSFNIFDALENKRFSAILLDIFNHNDTENFALKGRTSAEMFDDSLVGFCGEAWQVFNGAQRDFRKCRDIFVDDIPVDVKVKDIKHSHLDKFTIPIMTGKVNGWDIDNNGDIISIEEWKAESYKRTFADLQQLHIWEVNRQTGDMVFWKAIEIRDSKNE